MLQYLPFPSPTAGTKANHKKIWKWSKQLMFTAGIVGKTLSLDTKLFLKYDGVMLFKILNVEEEEFILQFY